MIDQICYGKTDTAEGSSFVRENRVAVDIPGERITVIIRHETVSEAVDWEAEARISTAQLDMGEKDQLLDVALDVFKYTVNR